MAHFVITRSFHGGPSFAVEFFHECTDLNGRQKQHLCYALPEAYAALPLDVLIDMYKNGVRPKAPKPQLPQPVERKYDMQMTRKITARSIGCELAKADFIILGKATRMEKDESEYGSFIRLFGSFKAKNLRTEGEFYSAQAILPGIAEDLLAGAVAGLGAGESVQFALRLWNEEVERTPQNMMGFVWACETIGEMSGFAELDTFSNELARTQSGNIRKALETKPRQAALPAPDADKGDGGDGATVADGKKKK